VLFWPVFCLAASDLVSVARVFDGDTCLLEDGRRLRLAGIDAPETSHDTQPAQYYAKEATALLARLTMGQPLRLVVAGEGRDRFGRVLGDLKLPDGASISERLVAEGAAYYFWHADLPNDLTERLLTVQRRAMATGLGFWPQILALPAQARPYIGNIASRRFHAPDCPDARRISPRNRVVLPTLADAFGRGLAPARNCTPWPIVKE
jgi:micrococcal nuclease